MISAEGDRRNCENACCFPTIIVNFNEAQSLFLRWTRPSLQTQETMASKVGSPSMIQDTFRVLLAMALAQFVFQEALTGRAFK